MVSDSPFANKLEKLIQTFKVIILVDETYKISRVVVLLTRNIIKSYVNSTFKVPGFILNIFGEIYVIPKLEDLLISLEKKLSK
ncbi:hypothetical protein [Mycoplasma sp. CSL7503-lung]|uniref:hypothetical protein n=1 Tax=Mycoplasma sp. CSL7503-lung TaxID=536372 RepID=UPI0021CE8941|nr:hypothetical protein [Mycoplasma sp. CSL7503-lung]MCU4706355.1 hypothetical protein [Mycoplasma sp. CSL7503-lung]